MWNGTPKPGTRQRIEQARKEASRGVLWPDWRAMSRSVDALRKRSRTNRIDGTAACKLALILFVPGLVFGSPLLLDFEGFADGTFLTTQYPGVSFSNAQVLSAGVSLNEFEFPPHSGVNVVSDAGGPLSISFSTDVTDFGGFFTYGTHLLLAGFDRGNNKVASATSMFTNNEGLSGVPGSGPNEFIQLNFPNGISSVTITGDLSGGSFALDDVGFTPIAANTVPEPTTGFMVFSGGILALTIRKALKSTPSAN
jgi:hypothetical protein